LRRDFSDESPPFTKDRGGTRRKVLERCFWRFGMADAKKRETRIDKMRHDDAYGN